MAHIYPASTAPSRTASAFVAAGIGVVMVAVALVVGVLPTSPVSTASPRSATAPTSWHSLPTGWNSSGQKANWPFK